MSVNDQYALNWSNHTTHIRKAFDSLLAGSEFVDVTLSCEGKKISAHKMLLSACSTYFHDLFRENPCQHPIVILKDVKFQNLVDILRFMYNGEVSVATENFDSFLKTAELLQVSGLTDDETRQGPGEKEEEGTENSQVSLTEKSERPNVQPALVKKPISEAPKEKEVVKKRVNDNTTLEEGTSHKKKKDSELKPDIEIKQEEADMILDEESLEIKDPLELNQSEPLEGLDMLQPAGSQKFADVHDLLNDDQHLENKCPLCLKTFTHPLSLVQHRHVHTGSTVCPICKVVFSRKYNLKTHMRNVHNDHCLDQKELYRSIWGEHTVPKNVTLSTSVGVALPLIQVTNQTFNPNPPALVSRHFPTQIPRTEKKQYPTRNCRYCPGRKETRWECVPCGNIPLHNKTCFEDYHNKLLMGK